MDQILEQFRLDCLSAIQTETQKTQFLWARLRSQFLDNNHVEDEDLKARVFIELGQIQLRLEDINEQNEETTLQRFKVVSKIVLLLLKPDQDALTELTKVATRYFQDYRKSKTGVFYGRALSEQEDYKLRAFQEKLVKIQQELYRTHISRLN